MTETMTFPRTRQGVRNLDEIGGNVLPVSGGPAPARVNVGETERWVSGVAGGVLTLCGLSQGSLSGLLLALAGGSLLYRGVTGHCHLYSSLGIDTAHRPSNAEIVHRARGH